MILYRHSPKEMNSGNRKCLVRVALARFEKGVRWPRMRVVQMEESVEGVIIEVNIDEDCLEALVWNPTFKAIPEGGRIPLVHEIPNQS